MMNVSKKFGKSPTIGDLSVTALYELASSTADVQAEVERRIAAGEIIGAADIKRYTQSACGKKGPRPPGGPANGALGGAAWCGRRETIMATAVRPA
jgi:hypothetical protein